ncbi:MAG: polysaccharide biosynthesis protein [Kiritimatiellae bacterium]|nr:polysaccharide biosynthesis protein [Kiritimatiellia bacterium]
MKKKLFTRLAGISRLPHQHLRRKGMRFSLGQLAQYILDLVALGLVFVLSYYIRFDFGTSPDTARFISNMPLQLPFVILLQWACMLLFRTYRRMWRFTSLIDLPPFFAAFLASGGLLSLLRAMVPRLFGSKSVFFLPYSIVLLTSVLGLAAVLALRIARRMTFEWRARRRVSLASGGRKASRIVLLGAGAAGVMVAREMKNRADSDQKVIGFLDDDPVKQGTLIAGIPVMGPIRAIHELAARNAVDEAIITLANAPRHKIARVIRQCRRAGVPSRIIPALYEIVNGHVAVGAIREVDIVDLLGRDVVTLEADSIRSFVRGRRVLVTGAGGSIGSELVRQVARFGPARLCMLDQCEWALYEINREMVAQATGVPLRPVIADITNTERMEAVFAQERPEVVIHAAAYKHVPMMEANVREAVVNNIGGTLMTARLAGLHKANVFVMVSTDKAVNPTSVMGTTKRVAELVVQQQAGIFPSTRYVSVRFGNVLGSSGSVIPLFREQIKRGGPVTVTHPDMRRYFMTIPEASSLVLQSAALGNGGEIFVLDMGTPVKIDQLAREMIRLSGLQPDIDIPIRYTGLRPGEKMFEELSTREESVDKTKHPKIFVGKIAKPDMPTLEKGLKVLQDAVAANDEAAMRNALSALVPEATLSSAG